MSFDESSEDKNLECVDCHTMFIFTVGEQDFFTKKRLLDSQALQALPGR